MNANGELRDFLVTRRARLTPEAAGIEPFAEKRREPGLRREEVALLAGVSIDYYTRFQRDGASGPGSPPNRLGSLDEARFLTAVPNSSALTDAVRPFQSRGQHNPRHFDKYIWQLPIPILDSRNSSHRWPVALAERAEGIAANDMLLS